MNPFSRDHQSHTREPAATQASSTLNPSGKAPQDSHTGGKSTGGKVGTVPTAANTGLGIEKPKAFDAQGAIGKQFTGEFIPISLQLAETTTKKSI